MYTLIATAKLNDIDPQAWLADVLARLPDHPARRIHELLPYSWSPPAPSDVPVVRSYCRRPALLLPSASMA